MGNEVNCRVCGNPFFAGRTVFRCSSCGSLAHSWCWEKHVLETHKPPSVIGSIDLDGNFVPSKDIGGEKITSAGKEIVQIK